MRYSSEKSAQPPVELPKLTGITKKMAVIATTKCLQSFITTGFEFFLRTCCSKTQEENIYDIMCQIQYAPLFPCLFLFLYLSFAKQQVLPVSPPCGLKSVASTTYWPVPLAFSVLLTPLRRGMSNMSGIQYVLEKSQLRASSVQIGRWGEGDGKEGE